MAIPVDDIDTSDVDEGTDTPPRAEFLKIFTRVKELIAWRGEADGVASLDEDGLVPSAQLLIGRGCLVYNSVTQSIPNSTNTKLNWDTNEYDDLSIHNTVTNNERLTVPAGVGRVKITLKVAWFTSATGVRHAYILKNGSTSYTGSVNGYKEGSTTNIYEEISTASIEVVEGDFFEGMVMQDSGGNLTAFSTSFMSFSMEVVR